MTQRLLFLLLFAIALAACTTTTTEDTLPLDPCLLDGGLEAQCSLLTVPENRADPNGRLIDINLAVIPAQDSLADPSPLFFIPGGPGQAATETYPLTAASFEEINRTHDIVLVDQRGTGDSNPLVCPALEEEELDITTPDDDELRELARDCRDSLADADLTQYTTAVAVADLEAVRQALGYDEINLYGASYGTRVALAYLRTYPQQVRAAVLDAVVSPDYRLFLESPQDAQQALDFLFQRCAADPTCSETFPNLQAKFEALLDRLEASPVTVEIADPMTGAPQSLELDRDTLPQLLFNLSYSPEFVALLPLMITEAEATGDFGPLVAQALLFVGSTGINDGMFYAVVCTEDAPFMTLAEAEAASEGTYFAPMARPVLTICGQWPAGQLPADFRDPLPAAADAPVLLLSGEADPVTPPRYAARVAEMLPNARHLIAPGMGHGVINRGCLPHVAADFINAASLDGLDTACVADIEPPPFFVNFLGPAPGQ